MGAGCLSSSSSREQPSAGSPSTQATTTETPQVMTASASNLSVEFRLLGGGAPDPSTEETPTVEFQSDENQIVVTGTLIVESSHGSSCPSPSLLSVQQQSADDPAAVAIGTPTSQQESSSSPTRTAQTTVVCNHHAYNYRLVLTSSDQLPERVRLTHEQGESETYILTEDGVSTTEPT